MTIGPIPEDHPSSGKPGTYVSAVDVDGPAARAGVRQGYIIVSIRRAGRFIPLKSARVVEAAIREQAKQGKPFTILEFANGATRVLKLSQFQSRSSPPDGPAIADAGQRKTTPARAAAASEPPAKTQRAAGAHFEIEGIRLGMTGAQIAAVLREKGYTSPLDSTLQFRKGDARDSPKIKVRYKQYKRVASLPRDQWPVNEIHFMPVGARQDAKTEQLFRSLVAKYGEPDKCRPVLERVNHTCTWTRRSNGGEETLQWEWPRIARPSIRLTGTVPPAKPSDAQADESAPRGPGGVGRTAQAAASEPAATTQGAAGAPFELEGIRLGMASAQIAAVLRGKGYTPQDRPSGRIPLQFRKGEAPAGPRISVRYKFVASLPQDQLPVTEIRFRTGIGNTEDAKTEQLFQSLVAKYGEPHECRLWRDRVNRACTWIRRSNGGEERLFWEWVARPYLSLTGRGLR